MFNSVGMTPSKHINYGACKIFSSNTEQLKMAQKNILARGDCKIIEIKLSKSKRPNDYRYFIFEKKLPSKKFENDNITEILLKKHNAIKYSEDRIASIETSDLNDVHYKTDAYGEQEKLIQQTRNIKRKTFIADFAYLGAV